MLVDEVIGRIGLRRDGPGEDIPYVGSKAVHSIIIPPQTSTRSTLTFQIPS
ncbi:MAG: hypothetical protein HQL47_07405 [Gammaproteobacteria bacterium]|nr:hypothetical protein [Gammaproteobacteria bacterium]